MDIHIRVRKQVLTCRQNIIAGSVRFVKAHFMFDDEWDGTEKHVIFSNESSMDVEIKLDEASWECLVPWEVIETEGELYISVVGYAEGEVRITTKLMDNPIIVYPHGKIEGSDPSNPTPNVWDEIKSALPVDWDNNDSDSLSYVKNRTHWKEEVEVDYIKLPYVEPIQGLGFAPYGKKLGLQIGQVYTVSASSEGQIYSLTATATEIPKDVLGVVIPGVAWLYIREYDLRIVDGLDGDFATGTITGTDNCYYNFFKGIENIKIQGSGMSGRDVLVHQIPSEYLPPRPIGNNYIETRMLKDGSVTGSKIEKPELVFEKVLEADVSVIAFNIEKYDKVRIAISGILTGLKDYQVNTLFFAFGSVSRILSVTPRPGVTNRGVFVCDVSVNDLKQMESELHYYIDGLEGYPGEVEDSVRGIYLSTFTDKVTISIGNASFGKDSKVEMYKILSKGVSV